MHKKPFVNNSSARLPPFNKYKEIIGRHHNNEKLIIKILTQLPKNILPRKIEMTKNNQYAESRSLDWWSIVLYSKSNKYFCIENRGNENISVILCLGSKVNIFSTRSIAAGWTWGNFFLERLVSVKSMKHISFWWCADKL